jgi:hypothetical protein
VVMAWYIIQEFPNLSASLPKSKGGMLYRYGEHYKLNATANIYPHAFLDAQPCESDA